MHQQVRSRNLIEVQHLGEIEHARQINPLIMSPLFAGKLQTDSVIYYPSEHYVVLNNNHPMSRQFAGKPQTNSVRWSIYIVNLHCQLC